MPVPPIGSGWMRGVERGRVGRGRQFPAPQPPLCTEAVLENSGRASVDTTRHAGYEIHFHCQFYASRSMLIVTVVAKFQSARGPEPRVVLAVLCRGAWAGEGSRSATQSGEVFFPSEWASDPRAGLGGCDGGDMNRGVEGREE